MRVGGARRIVVQAGRRAWLIPWTLQKVLRLKLFWGHECNRLLVNLYPLAIACQPGLSPQNGSVVVTVILSLYHLWPLTPVPKGDKPSGVHPRCTLVRANCVFLRNFAIPLLNTALIKN